MKRLGFTLVFSILSGCGGPSNDAGHVKTPDEIVAEQEALGAEQEKKGRNANDYAEPTEATDEEKKRLWDEDYAQLELKRASRSAETCPESVTEKSPKGRAHVTLVFQNDGNVKEARIADPYTETAVGKCVLRAMGALIVRTFEGPEKTVEWEIDLTGAKVKKSGPVGGAAEEKE